MSRKSESKESTNGKRKLPWLLLITAVAAAALVALIIVPDAPRTSAKDADIVVYKTPTCRCCRNWVAYLRDAGLKVRAVNVSDTQPIQSRVGVPRKLGSCHTAVVGDYWVEGHVPADLIQRLTTQKPDNIRGIAVPGMPVGPPGMEWSHPATYDVVAYDAEGNTTIYATRQGRSLPEDLAARCDGGSSPDCPNLVEFQGVGS